MLVLFSKLPVDPRVQLQSMGSQRVGHDLVTKPREKEVWL